MLLRSLLVIGASCISLVPVPCETPDDDSLKAPGFDKLLDREWVVQAFEAELSHHVHKEGVQEHLDAQSRFTLWRDPGDKIRVMNHKGLFPVAPWDFVEFEAPTQWQLEWLRRHLVPNNDAFCASADECLIGVLDSRHHDEALRPPGGRQYHMVFLDMMEKGRNFCPAGDRPLACLQIHLFCYEECNRPLPKKEPLALHEKEESLRLRLTPPTHGGSGHAHTGG